MKKTVLAICALIPAIAHGADDATSFIFRFSDEPGVYNIKVESVKNVRTPGAHNYTSITKKEEEYTQEEDFSFAEFFSLAKDATHIRISVRKQDEGGKFKRGGYAYISAPQLRNLATQLKNKKKWAAGIALENQFDSFAQGKAEPAVDADSLFIQ